MQLKWISGEYDKFPLGSRAISDFVSGGFLILANHCLEGSDYGARVPLLAECCQSLKLAAKCATPSLTFSDYSNQLKRFLI